jgi:hypothetical protein
VFPFALSTSRKRRVSKSGLKARVSFITEARTLFGDKSSERPRATGGAYTVGERYELSSDAVEDARLSENVSLFLCCQRTWLNSIGALN